MPRSGRARLLGRALESGRPGTLEAVRATGQGALSEAFPFFAARTLPREEVYIRPPMIRFSPATGGPIDGIFSSGTEVTDDLIGARRLETLKNLRSHGDCAGLKPSSGNSENRCPSGYGITRRGTLAAFGSTSRVHPASGCTASLAKRIKFPNEIPRMSGPPYRALGRGQFGNDYSSLFRRGCRVPERRGL